MTGKANVWARQRARRALLQAVYQWQVSAPELAALKADFRDGDALKKADVELFDELLGKVVRQSEQLDAAFAELLDRRVSDLDHIEHAILRLAAAEFTFRIDIPYRVVINEYVELAKTFGATDSYKYINGVLDKLAARLRTIEVEAAARG